MPEQLDPVAPCHPTPSDFDKESGFGGNTATFSTASTRSGHFQTLSSLLDKIAPVALQRLLFPASGNEPNSRHRYPRQKAENGAGPRRTRPPCRANIIAFIPLRLTRGQRKRFDKDAGPVGQTINPAHPISQSLAKIPLSALPNESLKRLTRRHVERQRNGSQARTGRPAPSKSSMV